MLGLPPQGGPKILLQARARAPRSAKIIVLLTAQRVHGCGYCLLEQGAAGVLLKPLTRSELVRAVRAVLAGNLYLSPRIREWSAPCPPAAVGPEEPGGQDGTAGTASGEQTEAVHLTSCERRILLLRPEDKSEKEIAEILHRSLNTVRNHLVAARAKLHVGCTAAAVAKVVAGQVSTLHFY